MTRFSVERAHQAFGVEPLDVLDDAPVQRHRRSGILVVREIAAGDEQRIGCMCFDGVRDGGAQSKRGLARLVAHHHRNDGHARQHVGNERHLHFQTMLAPVRGGQIDNLRRGIGHRFGERAVDLHRSERCLPLPVRPDRDALKWEEMRRADQHDRRVLMASGDVVGEGGHRTRVHQSRVGRHNRAQPVGWIIDSRSLEIAVQVRHEPRRVVRVPSASD